MAGSGFAATNLRSFIHRIEQMNEEIEAAQSDRKEIYAEAKGSGFDPHVMREVVRIRKMDKADYDEKLALLDLYLTAMRASPEARLAACEVLQDEPQHQVQTQ
jgi:uncharacterized protein (UPF0335 family)